MRGLRSAATVPAMLLAPGNQLSGGDTAVDELQDALAATLAAIAERATEARMLVGSDETAVLALTGAIGTLAGGALGDVRRLIATLPTPAQSRALADDLHDTLGHALSLAALLAGSARARLADEPRLARDALGQIAAVATQTGEELDALLAGRRRARLLSAGALAGFAAGQPVVFDVDGPALAAAPEEVAFAVYRIVQESLTNARKHACGAAVRVRVAHELDALTVTVVSDEARSAELRGGGRGIPGMRRRAQAVGGELVAGPDHRGGFRVDARLPLDRRRIRARRLSHAAH